MRTLPVITIRPRGAYHHTLELDGVDISHMLSRVQIDIDARHSHGPSPAEVTLTFVAQVNIDSIPASVAREELPGDHHEQETGN